MICVIRGLHCGNPLTQPHRKALELRASGVYPALGSAPPPCHGSPFLQGRAQTHEHSSHPYS